MSDGGPNAGWWFGTFFIFPYIGNNRPNLPFFSEGLKPPTGYDHEYNSPRCPLDERGIDDALDEVAWLLWTWCVLERIYFHDGFSIAMLVYCRVLHVYILVHMNAYEII